MLSLHPCTISGARLYCAMHHRHLPAVGGGRFAVCVVDIEGFVRGVGIVGNGPQVWEDTGKMSIVRVATDGAHNACSMIYGALCRAGKALGYTEAWTWTLPHEPGSSLRAAGFQYQGMTAGGEHDREKRPRNKAKNAEPKHRWMKILAANAGREAGK